MTQIPEGYEPGNKVVSRFGAIHVVANVEVDSSGICWITLRDGREFGAAEFRPYVEQFHGRLDVCEKCEARS